MKVLEIAFVGYPVADKKRAREFYEGVLGLKAEMDMAMGENFWIEYGVGADTLAISNYWDAPTGGRIGPAAAIEVEDFTGTVAMLKGKGVTFTEEPSESPMCTMSMISDPDNNSIWIHKRHANREPYSGPEIPFVAYPVADRQRAYDFYEGVLGLKRTPNDFVGPDGFWSEYNIGNRALAVVGYWKPAEKAHLAPSIGLEVENFDEALAEIRARNIPITMEPMETPVCHLCVILDPDSNSIFIHKRKPGHN